MKDPYLQGARARWLGAPEDLKHRVGYRQFKPEIVDWYWDQIFRPLTGLGKERVLEYGCGVGRLLVPFSRRGGYWYGVDISPDMVAQIPLEGNLAGVAVTDGDGIPDSLVEDRSVDIIYSVLTLQHVASHGVITEILRSFRRKLAPRGRVVVQVKKFREGLRPWDYVPPPDGKPEPVGYRELPIHLHDEEGCAYLPHQLEFHLGMCGLHGCTIRETDPIDDHGRWLWAEVNDESS